MNIGDIVLFNPNGRFPGYHFGIENGEKLKITHIGDPYSYAGMNSGETCVRVDFEIVRTGEKRSGFSSQWVEEDGFDL